MKEDYKNLIKFLLCFCVIYSSSANAGLKNVTSSADKKGLQRTIINNSIGRQVGLYEESHALIIGVSDYTNGWPDLFGVNEDVKAVRLALIEQGFNVVTVMNPNSRDLDDAYESFIRRYGGKLNNRLLFYFAGHGYSMKPKYGGASLGYIVPKEAPRPEREPDAFKQIALSMQRIEEYALNIDAKHAMFVFDSCFSGSLFSITRAIPKHISYKTSKPIRLFITSGSENEEVPDVSIFRRQFISALHGEGDTNRDGYVTGAELGEFLQTKVINYSKNTQHPQYGKIRNPNLDKGDFVFKTINVDNADISNKLDLYGYRTAIVIGNSDYYQFPLRNPVNDAKDIASKLEKKGFEVKTLLNANRNDIIKSIADLKSEAQKPGVLLFYFAGHGLMVDGESYIIPIDADIENEQDIKNKALGVDYLFSKYKDMDKDKNKDKNKRRLIRTNGDYGGDYGHIFAYATSPGGMAMDGEGRNGVYTKHVLNLLDRSGVEIHEMFRKVRAAVETETKGIQVPNESSYAKKAFYFSPTEPNSFDKSFIIFIFDTVRSNPFASYR